MRTAHLIKRALAFMVLGSCFALTGCTPEEQRLLPVLEESLNSLVQNRSLTEAFVRDIKADVDPSNPDYAELMESYQNAREAYGRYLDSLESPQPHGTTRSLRQHDPSEVRNATADFLADATRALRPMANTRRIPFQRAVVIPDDLAQHLSRLSRKTRDLLLDKFDQQVRWRSWGEL